MLEALMGNRSIQRKFQPHPYQVALHSAVEREWEAGNRKALSVLPTGAGKTVAAGELIARHVERREPCLIVAHQVKLVSQFAESLAENYGIYAAVAGGGARPDGDDLVLCSTVQSMSTLINKKKYPKDHFKMICVDECHRSLGGAHQKVIDYFDTAKVLGLTATPRRGDQRDIMDIFDAKAIDIPLNQLIEGGFLSKLVVKNVPLSIRVEGKGKDFSDQEVGHAIESYLPSCAAHLVEEGRGRCCLAFLPLIEISKKFTSLINDQEGDFKAGHVDGTMDKADINEMIRKLEDGELDCLCCSMLLTEGVDIRPVSLIMNLRLTKSWTLYVQTVGRGTRLFDPAKHQKLGRTTKWPLKTECVLLDPLWLCDEHSLIQRPSCLVATNDEEAEEIDLQMKSLSLTGGGADLMKAATSATHEREEKLRERLELMAARGKRLVDAVELFGAIGRTDLADYEPLTKQDRRKYTEGQKAMLMQHGVDLQSVKDQGHAKLILDEVRNRSKQGLAPMRMAKEAKNKGMDNPWLKSYNEVKDFLSAKRGPIKKWDKPFDEPPI